MSLIAAVAIGIALDRWREAPFDHQLPGVSYSNIGFSSWFHVLNYGRPSCYIVAATLVLFPLRWRRPRKPLERAGCLVGLSWIIASVVSRVLSALPLG